jgi:hypothetical protein
MAEPESKSRKLEEQVYRLEKGLQNVQKRTEQNFRYIDNYDDSFSKVFLRLNKVEQTLRAHASSINMLAKRPQGGKVHVPRVQRVRRPGQKKDMAGVDPADIEALWIQIDAILVALEEMRAAR